MSSSYKETLKKVHQEGGFGRAFNSKFYPFFSGLWHLVHNPGKMFALHCPDYVDPDPSERALIERIFNSYKKMKEAQSKAEPHYQPSSMWQAHIDHEFVHIVEGLQNNDIEKFHFFLANFGTWKQYHGLESTTFMRGKMKSLIGRRYLQSEVFYKQWKTWQWFTGEQRPFGQLSYPTIGNQVGAHIHGHFVGIGSFFNDIYGSMLSGLVENQKRPVIADLGAGYGKLAYFITRGFDHFCFIDFDLPETLCLAAYYLIKAFPDKKALLYGEQDYHAKVHDQFDLIFMPSFEIENLSDESVDLFINKNSLGEMTKKAVENYVHHVCRSTKYFFHMNHDRFPNYFSNNERGLLAHEYPVPEDQFTLIFRYPDLGHLLYKGWYDPKMDIFVHLYQRKDQAHGDGTLEESLTSTRKSFDKVIPRRP